MNIERTKNIFIEADKNLLDALNLMDKSVVKALIILKGDLYVNLLSIGDIQRAILKNLPLTTMVTEITRSTTIVAYEDESEEDIKIKLFDLKADFIPVVSTDKKIIKVYFWSDFFNTQNYIQPSNLLENVPVVVMAGGLGTRLKPLTYVIPKPLIPIGDHSILEEIINKFSNLGAKNYFLSVNYKADLIKFYLKDKIKESIDIEYIEEDKPLGTGGALYMLKNKLKNTFIVTNCDIVIEENYIPIYEYHKNSKNDITIVAAVKHLKIPYGTLETGDDGALLSMIEKPDITFLVNTGMYILEPNVLEHIQDDTLMHITELFDKVKSAGGKVGVFPISEKSWYDIGEWKEYMNILNKYM
ncbi:MAG: sugar phosphate nucleotidyltransferase [Ferruginibacter sp.]